MAFLLLLIGASTPCWTFSLGDYMSPFLGNVVAELNSVPLPLPWTSTPTKCMWPADPALKPTPGSCWDPGAPCQLGRGSAWAMWSKCACAFMSIPGLNPHWQQRKGFSFENILLSAKRDTEKVHKIAVLAVIITGLCDITGDWSFSSDQDNCCAEWIWEKSLPNCVHLSSISQSSLCAQKVHCS